MVILNEHFKEVEKRLDFPQEAVEIFEKTAAKIEKTKSLNKKFEAIFNEFLFPEAHKDISLMFHQPIVSIAY